MANTLTLCFAGTNCWPDQGLKKDQDEYNAVSGYIPAHLHQQLTEQKVPSFIIPGCGEPYNALHQTLKVQDWRKVLEDNSPSDIQGTFSSAPPPAIFLDAEAGLSINYLAAHAIALIVGAPVQYLNNSISPADIGAQQNSAGATVADTLGLNNNPDVLNSIASNPRLYWLEDDLAKLTAATKVDRVNLIGHSRGGVVAIAVVNLIALYLPHIEVNLIGLDPVPGTGNWPENMCTLPQSVLAHYLGVYAIDEVSNFFNGVVPAIGEANGTRWLPLTSAALPAGLDPSRYQLVFSRGRHATIPGSQMKDGGGYNKANISALVGSVGELVHYLVLNRLRNWGTADRRPAPDTSLIDRLKADIDNDGEQADGVFYSMRDYTYDKGLGSVFRWDGHSGYHKARGVSDVSGRNPMAWNYLEGCLPVSTPFADGFTNNKDIPRVDPAPFRWQALTSLSSNEDFGSQS